MRDEGNKLNDNDNKINNCFIQKLRLKIKCRIVIRNSNHS